VKKAQRKIAAKTVKTNCFRVIFSDSI